MSFRPLFRRGFFDYSAVSNSPTDFTATLLTDARFSIVVNSATNPSHTNADGGFFSLTLHVSSLTGTSISFDYKSFHFFLSNLF